MSFVSIVYENRRAILRINIRQRICVCMCVHMHIHMHTRRLEGSLSCHFSGTIHLVLLFWKWSGTDLQLAELTLLAGE